MMQKEVITNESYDEVLNQYNKEEYVIISRNEYNNLIKQSLACKIVYTNNVKPYLVTVQVNGLRRNSRVNTISIYTLKHSKDSGSRHECVGNIKK